MDKKHFDNLIEKANQGSKNDFLRFIKNIYGVDEALFDHIWRVPVIAYSNSESLVTTSLSTKTKEDLIKMVNDFVTDELGDSNGCFIPFNKMAVAFTLEELEEWKEKLDNKELNLDYNAVIIYDDYKLKNYYDNLKNSDETFINFVKHIITHERCHLNASYLVTEVEKYREDGIEKNEFASSEINGASLTDIEQDNIISSGKNTELIHKYNYERNEVLIDTLSQMMNNYKDGDSLEDCLFKVIKQKNWTSSYKNLDFKEVLTMYTLHPEKLTEWATFGAYDFIRKNELREMIVDVCGTDKPLSANQFNKKVREYINKQDTKAISSKQKEMLEMLGISLKKKNNDKDLGSFSNSLLDVKSFIKNIDKDDYIK